MIEIQRYSPVSFNLVPKRMEKRDNWKVALEYEKEDAETPFIIDLSHRTRFDVQDSSISSIKPFGITIPDTPGLSVFDHGFLVNRMNRTQASLWHLSGKEIPEMPEESAYTDVTESTMFIALVGENVFSIAEKLTALDFLDPERKPPFLFQGPVCHVPCQIVTLKKEGDLPGLMFTCSRGYGQVMTHAVMEAGKEFGISPAGEDFFTSWLEKL